MFHIVVLFPKPNDAKNIRNLLVRSGFSVTAVCTSGGQVISRLEDMDEGLVVCGYKYTDMMYHELHKYLPKEFEMLVITSQLHIEEVRNDEIECITMPIKIYDLVDKIHEMISEMVRKKKKRKRKVRERTPEEKRIIEEAKLLIMQNNGMLEAEAHSYLQKRSMDSGVNLVEMAQIILNSY